MSKNNTTIIKTLIANMKKSTKQQKGKTRLGKFKTWMSSLDDEKKEA
jgi:hypothetical protein